MPLVDPYASPYANQYDPGTELGSLYQEDAQNKIAQARVAQRKDYTSGLAGHYGITDVASKVKGLSDTALFELATNLVNARRKAAGQGSAPGAGAPPTPKPVPPKPAPAPKPAPKPATKAAPRVTAKRSTTTKSTTARRPAPRVTAKTTAAQAASRLYGGKIGNLGTL